MRELSSDMDGELDNFLDIQCPLAVLWERVSAEKGVRLEGSLTAREVDKLAPSAV